jgi:hypothetical protein
MYINTVAGDSGLVYDECRLAQIAFEMGFNAISCLGVRWDWRERHAIRGFGRWRIGLWRPLVVSHIASHSLRLKQEDYLGMARWQYIMHHALSTLQRVVNGMEFGGGTVG